MLVDRNRPLAVLEVLFTIFLEISEITYVFNEKILKMTALPKISDVDIIFLSNVVVCFFLHFPPSHVILERLSVVFPIPKCNRKPH